MTEQRLRTQAGMVLHALERDLGDFVRARVSSVDDLDPAIIHTILSKHKPTSILPDDIDAIIETTYLADLWTLAETATRDDRERSYLGRLISLSETLDLYAIRNAVAHPNRPFPETYWWRMGVLATDPNCELLQFASLHSAFRRAEAGTLDDLPEEWLAKLTWHLPNNLPEHLDFDETGLIGRKKERESLNSLLKSTRNPFVAVIAPGGIGKTALVLSVLKELVLQPDSPNFFSAVCYISLKTEHLTATGLQTTRTYLGRNEIRDDILATLRQFTSQHEYSDHDGSSVSPTTPILLCIDNVETILRDDADFFITEIYDNLPPNVRVIVTSRIQVDSARSFPLRPMEFPQAELLARKYCEARNQIDVSEDRLRRIAEGGQCNPLAIRLIIDRIALRGYEVSEATTSAQRDIAEFSFTNLLDVLDESAVLVLESIFVKTESTAADIAILLDETREEVMESVNVLVKTSIVTRDETSDVEYSYRINPSVQEFMLVSDRNISAREFVNSRITNFGRVDQEVAETQQVLGVSEFRWFYMPDDTPSGLKEIGRGARVLGDRRRRSEDVREVYDQLKRQAEAFSEFSVYQALLGKCLERFGAMGQAERHIRRACELSSRAPRYIAMLGRFYHERERFDEAYVCYKELRDAGMAEPEVSDQVFANAVETGYFLSLLFSHQYEQVMSLTEEWEQFGRFWRQHGTFRASAIKRMAEKRSRRERVFAANRALNIMDVVVGATGEETEAWILKQFGKVVAELLHCLAEDYELDEEEETAVVGALEVVARHIFDAEKEEARRSHVITRFARLKLEGNPFAGRHMLGAIRSIDEARRVELMEEGLTEITITNIPDTGFTYPNYLFGKAEDGTDYFCHFTAFEQRGGSWEEWRRMSVGERMMIRPGAVPPGKASPRAEEFDICYL